MSSVLIQFTVYNTDFVINRYVIAQLSNLIGMLNTDGRINVTKWIKWNSILQHKIPFTNWKKPVCLTVWEFNIKTCNLPHVIGDSPESAYIEQLPFLDYTQHTM
jgi:hypothetical protein